MKKNLILFGDDVTPIPSERVENEVDDLKSVFNCPNCMRINAVKYESGWKQIPSTLQCECGYLLTLWIREEDQEYFLYGLAMAPDRE